MCYVRDLFRFNFLGTLYFAELSSLQHRQQQQACDFFQSLLDPKSRLHSLLPAPCERNLVARLCVA